MVSAAGSNQYPQVIECEIKASYHLTKSLQSRDMLYVNDRSWKCCVLPSRKIPVKGIHCIRLSFCVITTLLTYIAKMRERNLWNYLPTAGVSQMTHSRGPTRYLYFYWPVKSVIIPNDQWDLTSSINLSPW